ncbi:hypothetical protein RFI_28508 [Reticulomyxa filosa]|uniref:Uncharacterized protein n=1 Tax=Reticulomyxa filosa TaxID=46433 RepID=X6M4I5_RETFI|nr:hypothetical protein RFI_28508 [Reticulomyxa filosa]|eukprot:ETO08878.1 hypothetical protein RFI_28508 [Reticulomyxa filosa]
MFDAVEDKDGMQELDFEIDERYMPKKPKLKVELMEDNEEEIDKEKEDDDDKKEENEEEEEEEEGNEEENEENSEFEDAILKAEPVGDDRNVLETMKLKEEMETEQLKKQKQETGTRSTSASKEKIANNAVNKEWNLLDLRGKNDIIGESNLRDIPFLLTIPETFEEFEELILDKSPEEQLTLFKRMRGTNHVRLQSENRGKIIRLYDMLMEHLKLLCTHFEPKADTSDPANVSFYQYIDVMTRTLFALSHDVSDYAYQCHKNKLSNISTHLHDYYDPKTNQHLFSPSNGVDKEHKTDISFMPSGYLLFYLKTIAHIFPKDSKNNNLTACVLLILNKIITQIPIQGSRDVLCYIFCIQLVLEIVEKRQRYVPEVVRGLFNLMRAGFMNSNELIKNQFDLLKETDDLYFLFKPGSNIWNIRVCVFYLLFYFYVRKKGIEIFLYNESAKDEIASNERGSRLPIRWIFLTSNAHPRVFETRDFKSQLLYATLSLLEQSHKMWKNFLAYTEVFGPFLDLLQKHETMILSHSNGTEFANFYNNLFRQIYHRAVTQSLCRRPLHSIRRRIPLQMLEPEFDPDLKPTFLRLKVKNEKHLEKKKFRLLKKAKRKQERSLMRELTRDTQFIMAERVKRKKEHEAKTKAKWVHEYQSLMEQARDTNTFQMVGKKLKKRMVKQGVIRGLCVELSAFERQKNENVIRKNGQSIDGFAIFLVFTLFGKGSEDEMVTKY